MFTQAHSAKVGCVYLSNEQGCSQSLKFSVHHNKSLDSFLQVDKRGVNGLNQAIEPLHLLHQHCVHTLFIGNWILAHCLLKIKAGRKLYVCVCVCVCECVHVHMCHIVYEGIVQYIVVPTTPAMQYTLESMSAVISLSVSSVLPLPPPAF